MIIYDLLRDKSKMKEKNYSAKCSHNFITVTIFLQAMSSGSGIGPWLWKQRLLRRILQHCKISQTVTPRIVTTEQNDP